MVLLLLCSLFTIFGKFVFYILIQFWLFLFAYFTHTPFNDIRGEKHCANPKNVCDKGLIPNRYIKLIIFVSFSVTVSRSAVALSILLIVLLSHNLPFLLRPQIRRRRLWSGVVELLIIIMGWLLLVFVRRGRGREGLLLAMYGACEEYYKEMN